MRVSFSEGLAGPRSRQRIVLLHGPDAGRIEQWADRLTVSVTGAVSDPFLVATLERDDPGIEFEYTSASLMGGRRVVRVRDCLDRTVPKLAAALSRPSANLLIATAGVLQKRSKLLEWAEATPEVASVECPAERPEDRRDAARAILAEAGKSVTPEGMDRLMSRLPEDVAGVRAELEKLVLATGAAFAVAEAEIDDVLGDRLEGSLFATIDAALLGHGPDALAALDGMLAAGGGAVGLIRVLGGDLMRLQRAKAAAQAGQPVGAALQRARIWPKDPRRPVFEQALRTWRLDDVGGALRASHTAELSCKRTGANEGLIAGRLIGLVARLAKGASGG